MISIGNLAKLLSRGSRILVGTLSIRARSSAREATLIYHRYHENCSADFTMFLNSMCFEDFSFTGRTSSQICMRAIALTGASAIISSSPPSMAELLCRKVSRRRPKVVPFFAGK